MCFVFPPVTRKTRVQFPAAELSFDFPFAGVLSFVHGFASLSFVSVNIESTVCLC